MSTLRFLATLFVLTFLTSELSGNPLLMEDEKEEFGRIVNGRNAEAGNIKKLIITIHSLIN